MMLTTPQHAPLLFGRWRSRALRALPAAAVPLRDLVPGRRAPAFLDSIAPSLDEGFDAMRTSDTAWIAAELELAYAAVGTVGRAPTWVRDLHRGSYDAWQPVVRAQRSAFDALLAPVWPRVQDLHRAEFARYAAITAQHGIGHALTSTILGSRLNGHAWELPVATTTREVHPAGRGVLLLPTFHWTGDPLVSDMPGRPVTVTFPAGPRIPLPPSAVASAQDALAEVLGRTRLRILTLSGDGLSTSGLARGLGLSAATISVHTAALRAAGFITSARDGKTVVHRRTALGSLLLGIPYDAE
ncbi:winged helix-turn-helix domain-containing protein [Actinospica sp.]|uniref:ArsR/SmtB family transcription factor n=1 Tax=Actinospica sp. TaxID=1872142 RepID=UPI002CB0B2E4|nr:winged helix-turn-helix domain-containing protein [Actinospica sp.]HWG22779.1 winged helix-turn-helix domain-containing protein [Actinospica sp.]